MAGRCDAVTTEFENVPAPSLASLAQDIPVAPAAAAVAICQDRAAEKAHFERAGVPCAPHAVIETTAAARGRGRRPAARHPQDRAPGLRRQGPGAWSPTAPRSRPRGPQLRQVPCVLEKRLPLALRAEHHRGARRRRRRWCNLPVQQNLHRVGILALTTVPAPDVTQSQSDQAIARATADRRVDGLRRRAVRRVLRAGRTARWSPTRWRRARTTPATTASTPATCRSSSCRCARWPACRWSRRASTRRARWSTCWATCGSTTATSASPTGARCWRCRACTCTCTARRRRGRAARWAT